MDITVRESARFVLVDPDERVLLFRVVERGIDDPLREPGAEARDRTFWITPGGGVEAGESIQAAAHRELFEETGLTVAELGDCVHYREKMLANATMRMLGKEHLFFTRLQSAAEISIAGHTELEQTMLQGFRWWTLSELQETDEVVYPEGFADLVRRLLKRESI